MTVLILGEMNTPRVRQQRAHQRLRRAWLLGLGCTLGMLCVWGALDLALFGAWPGEAELGRIGFFGFGIGGGSWLRERLTDLGHGGE